MKNALRAFISGFIAIGLVDLVFHLCGDQFVFEDYCNSIVYMTIGIALMIDKD